MKCIMCDKETSNPRFCCKSCADAHESHTFPKKQKTDVLNYRAMMRKKGKTLQILTTQCVSMEDAVKAALGVAHASSIDEMEELCIHEYGPGNVVRMLDAVSGVVETTYDARPPKDTPKVGQVIKATDRSRDAAIEARVDELIAATTTGPTLSELEERRVADKPHNVSPITQVKLRRHTLVTLACIEPPEKKGYGGRNG